MIRLLPFVLCLAGTVALGAQEPAKPAAKPAAEPQFHKTDGYPLDTCLVSGEDLDDSAEVFTVEGHTFKTCCKKCQAKIEKDPKTYVAKLEDAVTKAQGATYPLTTCPISGKTLTDKAVPVVVGTTLVKLCCGGCKDKLEAAPEKAIAKVQAAAFAQQSAHYTAKTCPVSGHDLDDSAVAVMHGTTLIKLCCEDCLEKLKATPNAMAAKVAPKAGAKKTETTGDKKDGDAAPPAHGKDPAAAAMVAPGGTGGAACCETGKATSGCCQAGSGCCQGEAATKPGKDGAGAATSAGKPEKKSN